MPRKSVLKIMFILMAAAALLIPAAAWGATRETGGDTRGSGVVRGYAYHNETGEAIPDVRVWLYNEDTDHGYLDYTDDTGHYEFDDLADGDYQIHFYNESYYDYDDDFTLSGGSDVRYDAYLDPYECLVYGYIYDSDTGEPVEDFRIRMENDSDWNVRYYDLGEEDGFYDFYVPPGGYVLEVFSQEYIDQEGHVDVEEGEELRVDFYLDPLSSITGTVYNAETLEPIPDIDVYLLEYTEGWGWHYYTRKRTNETGSYSLYMEADEYKLYVAEEGYKTFEQEVEVGENEHLEINIYFEVDHTRLSGYVYNLTSGEPLEDARVEVDNYDTLEWDRVYTNETGYYVVYPGPGECSVSVSKDGYKTIYDSVTMEEDVPVERDYYLEPYRSSISGTVYDDETGGPIDYAKVSVRGEGLYKTEHTDWDGGYEIHIDPGEYSVSVSEYGYVTYETTVEVREWEDYRLDVYLEPFNSTVFGYVTDTDGEPIVDAYMYLETDPYDNYSRYYSDSVYTDEYGYYEFECPPSIVTGKYTLGASADGYIGQEEEFELEQNEHRRMDFELQEEWSPGSIWEWIWEEIFG